MRPEFHPAAFGYSVVAKRQTALDRFSNQSARVTMAAGTHMTNLYGMHPSAALLDRFRSKPYQGQDPARAKIVVLGTDANYSSSISEHDFFGRILEYHEDGVAFWRKYRVHHPFLLPSYPFDRRRDGVRYHRNFQKMGLGPEFADQISFVELLDVPTIGNTVQATFFKLLRPEHLHWLEEVLLSGGDEKLVLINQRLSRTVHLIHRRTGALPALQRILVKGMNIGDSFAVGNATILNGYSFSHTVTDGYLLDLGARVREFRAGQALD